MRNGIEVDLIMHESIGIFFCESHPTLTVPMGRIFWGKGGHMRHPTLDRPMGWDDLDCRVDPVAPFVRWYEEL